MSLCLCSSCVSGLLSQLAMLRRLCGLRARMSLCISQSGLSSKAYRLSPLAAPTSSHTLSSSPPLVRSHACGVQGPRAGGPSFQGEGSAQPSLLALVEKDGPPGKTGRCQLRAAATSVHGLPAAKEGRAIRQHPSESLDEVVLALECLATADYGRHLWDAPRDGSCQYHSVKMCLEDLGVHVPHTIPQMRQRVADFVTGRGDAWAPFLLGSQGNSLNPRTWCDCQLCHTEFGDQVSLQAMTELYQFNVTVVTMNWQGRVSVQDLKPEGREVDVHIMLLLAGRFS